MTANQAALQQKQFYLFVCSHSFLIGLFPFFLPVFLYKQGLSLGEICLFIAASAVTFTLGMWLWDRVKALLSPRSLLGLCYLLELTMITTLVLCAPHIAETHHYVYLIAASYGLYQCFFWTTQRALFIQRSSSHNTGDRYGNFQVFVVAFLKLGVFLGGALLDKDHMGWLLAISALLSIVSFALVIQLKGPLDWPFRRWATVPINQVIRFKDKYRSREVFALDGFFLFLESYFWLLSLFLILKQSFMQLGFMIIAITIALSVVFFVLKKYIDRMPEQLVYTVSVVGYLASWLLRANLDDNLSLVSQFLYLCTIAFLTALFRLAFNKRFYDLALHYPDAPYILMKSYYSQSALIAFFGLLAWTYWDSNVYTVLNHSYIIAAVLTPVYFIYTTRTKTANT